MPKRLFTIWTAKEFLEEMHLRWNLQENPAEGMGAGIAETEAETAEMEAEIAEM
jgi:hypothetical protein